MSTDNMPQVCQRLVAKLASLSEYPPGALAIADSDRIRGTAFFPGGFGLWDPDGRTPALPPRPVVIVGNNWGTPKDHEWARKLGAEYSEVWPEKRQQDCKTWWNLLPILRGAGIEPEQCFFTNVYMGLKADNDSNLGDFPTTPTFDHWCREFLAFQLTVLTPSVVVALGMPAIRMLAQVVPELRGWLGPRGGERSFSEIQRLVHPATINSSQPAFSAVAIPHTCYPVNLSPGSKEEIELLRTAAVTVGLLAN
jgi:hypothetical protein